MDDREQLEIAIAAQEDLRGVVADAVIDGTVALLRERLAELTPVDQRRRQATVLFADLHGFTQLASHLDAEDVTNLMNDVWVTIDRQIETFGGHIDKHIGDGVMALWGAGGSKEDDPEQAVRAALAMQEALAQHRGPGVRTPEMRIGITTGPVVLGTVATTREFTAMGDTVNVASRLETAAPLGGVLVSHETYRHIRGVFDVKPLDPISVKGKDEPVASYLVLRAKPLTFRMPSRGVEGVETRTIGRDHDLAQLHRAFETVCTTGRCGAVSVVADAGVGKSRLLYEFESWLDLLPDEVYFLKARALAARQGVPNGLLHDLLGYRFGILDSDPPRTVATKLRDGAAPHLPPEAATLLGRWLGFVLPEDAPDRGIGRTENLSSAAAAHLVHFVRALADASPTVIMLEDLHWADDDSLDVLTAMVDQLATTPTLIVGAARLSFLERRPNWLSGAPGAERLLLEPLSPAAMRGLVDEMLRRLDVVPVELGDLVVDRAEGNPFYAEELIKMLIDDRVIVPSIDGDIPWRVDVDRLDVSSVPSTLTGVLETRLDGLAEGERRALQRASVVGRVFWDASVGALAEATWPDPATVRALAVACDREFVYRRDLSSIDIGDEFIFKHALLRDVTYETVLLRDRRRLHALAADWLDANSGERRTEFLEMIAEHHLLAGAREAAADLLADAGEHALESGRLAGAVKSLERAIALWDECGLDPRPSTLVAACSGVTRIGEYERAEGIFTRAAAAPLTPTQEAQVLTDGGQLASERGDREREATLLRQALAAAEPIGGRVLSQVLLRLGWYHRIVGEHTEAVARVSAALEVAEVADELADQSAALRLLAALKCDEGQFEDAIELSERALLCARMVGDLESEAMVVGNLGVIQHLLGDATSLSLHYEAAVEHYRAHAETAARLGVTSGVAVATVNLAQVSLRLGRLEATRQLQEQGLEVLKRSGSHDMLQFWSMVEADLLIAEGDERWGCVVLGALRSDDGMPEDLLEEVTRIIERLPPSPDVERWLATGAERGYPDVHRELVEGREAGRSPGAAPSG